MIENLAQLVHEGAAAFAGSPWFTLAVAVALVGLFVGFGLRRDRFEIQEDRASDRELS